MKKAPGGAQSIYCSKEQRSRWRRMRMCGFVIRPTATFEVLQLLIMLLMNFLQLFTNFTDTLKRSLALLTCPLCIAFILLLHIFNTCGKCVPPIRVLQHIAPPLKHFKEIWKVFANCWVHLKGRFLSLGDSEETRQGFSESQVNYKMSCVGKKVIVRDAFPIEDKVQPNLHWGNKCSCTMQLPHRQNGFQIGHRGKVLEYTKSQQAVNQSEKEKRIQK